MFREQRVSSCVNFGNVSTFYLCNHWNQMSKMQGLSNTTIFQHSLRLGYITRERRHEPTIRIRALIITSHVTCHMGDSYLCQHEGTYHLTLCSPPTTRSAIDLPWSGHHTNTNRHRQKFSLARACTKCDEDAGNAKSDLYLDQDRNN